MTTPQPKIKGANIVLIGEFNPKIFQPAWFSAEELIKKQEGEEAKIEIIHPDIVNFGLEWLNIVVTRDRFQVSTLMEPYYEIMRDLVMGTFKLLQHTPIRMIGINTEMHFLMKSTEEWHSLGHMLTPKKLWEGILDKPGMVNITMEGTRTDGYKGCIRVFAEPSKKATPGVCFRVNDHYQVKDPKSVLGCGEIIGILESSWRESIERSQKIIYSVLEKHENNT